jgi:hypothetical protein
VTAEQQLLLLLPGVPESAPVPAAAPDPGPPPPATDGCTPIRTSGRWEWAVDCPSCGQTHRHTGPGLKEPPCGGEPYTIPGGESTARPD